MNSSQNKPENTDKAASLIHEKIRLQHKRSELDNAFQKKSLELSTAEEEYNKSHQKLSEYARARTKDDLSDNERDMLDRLRLSASGKNEKLQLAKQFFNEASIELDELDRKMREIGDSCTVNHEDLKIHHDALAAAKDRVAFIQAAIDQQQGIIDKAQASIIPPDRLIHEYRQILSDIALGNIEYSEKAAIEKRISDDKAEAEKSAEIAKPTIERANITLSGLSPRLEKAKSELASIESLSNHYITVYLKGEAEREGENYLILCKELAKSFNRLIALSALSLQRGGKSFTTGFYATVVFPTFNLDSLEGHAKDVHLLRFDFSDKERRNYEQMEREKLIHMGIDLL